MSRAQALAIARAFLPPHPLGNRYDYYYTQAKLRTDPLYPGVLAELRGTSAPVLDLGCGLGRLVGDVGAEGGRRGPWARLRSPDRRRSRVTNLADFCIECNPALSA